MIKSDPLTIECGGEIHFSLSVFVRVNVLFSLTGVIWRLDWPWNLKTLSHNLEQLIK